MAFDAEFWVAIALVIFLGILGYTGCYLAMFNALDRRGDRIKRELQEARDLREEAEVLLGDALKRQRDAEHEIETIMEDARAQARQLVVDAKVSADVDLCRQTKRAEAKIALAESQAVAEIKAAAAEAAVAAAEDILIRAHDEESANKAFTLGIEAVKAEFASGLQVGRQASNGSNGHAI